MKRHFSNLWVTKSLSKSSFQIDLELEVFALYLPNGEKKTRKIEIKMPSSKKDIFSAKNG